MKPMTFSFLLAIALLAACPKAARADFQAGLNAYFAGDFATALKELTPEADAGDLLAQYYLGEMYLRGKGVERDFETAAVWYTRSAENGYPQAQAALGSMQMLGLGVPRHPSSAYFWLIVSVVWDEGDLRQDAMAGLGEIASQLSPEQKKAVAAEAARRWRGR